MTWSETGLEAVGQLVSLRTGLALANRAVSIEQGIRRAMGRARVTDLRRYLDLITGDSNALDDLVVELTVGETYFFREPAQFEFLRRNVLPRWRLRCEQGHTIRAWSAGCASGEEAYSLAMLLEQEGLGQQAHILGSDISRAALARAQRGVYGAWSLRGEGQHVALRYLTRSGTSYQLDEKIRRRVTLDYLNLALDDYPSLATGIGAMDVILCRNVLIYFDRDTIHRVAQKLCSSLGDEGWLLTAASDPPLADLAPLEAVITSEGVFYRKRSAPPLCVVEVPKAPLEELAPTVADPWIAGEAGASDGEAGADAPASPVEKVPDREEVVQTAFVRGDYARVLELTRGRLDDLPTAILRVRALANLKTADAEQTCATMIGRHPLSTELHYLHAVLLLDLGRDAEAIQAVRRVLYLDRTLALAHFTLGAILKRQGDGVGAQRAYRNARDLCLARPASELVPLAESEHAGRLAEAAAAQIALLDAAGGGS